VTIYIQYSKPSSSSGHRLSTVATASVPTATAAATAAAATTAAATTATAATTTATTATTATTHSSTNVQSGNQKETVSLRTSHSLARAAPPRCAAPNSNPIILMWATVAVYQDRLGTGM
jgi:hypothetical protein